MDSSPQGAYCIAYNLCRCESITIPNPHFNPSGTYLNHKRDWAAEGLEAPKPLPITRYNMAEAMTGLYGGSTYLAECLLLTAKGPRKNPAPASPRRTKRKQVQQATLF